MTQDEVKADIEAATDEFFQLINQRNEASTGVPRPPTIEETETSLDGAPFDFGLDPQPRAEAFPGPGGGGGGGGGPPTGACCKTNGDCDILTESACNAAGGEYQGNGTNCEDVECTGACCEGTDCFEGVAEDDCAGTFMGIGSDCGPPNPCALPDCACGFEAFDGSGRRFRTKTIHRYGSGTLTPTAGCPHGRMSNWDTTLIQSYNESCAFSQFCDGGSFFDCPMLCDGTLAHDDTCTPLGCQPQSCSGSSTTVTTHGPTSETWVTTGSSNPNCDATDTVDYTLSDECNPV